MRLTIQLLTVMLILGSNIGFASSRQEIPCLFIEGEKDGLEIKKKKYSPGSMIEDCRGARSVKRNSVLCFANKLNQKRCASLSESDPIDMEALQQGMQSSNIWQTIHAVFTGNQVKKYGGKRLKDASLLSGFPYGDVLLPQQSLAFPVSRIENTQLNEFKLYREDELHRHLFRTTAIQNHIRIPVANLRHGTGYQWVLQASGRNFTGSFRIAERADQIAFERTLEQTLAKSYRSTTSVLIIRAMLADEYGYLFDRDIAIKEADVRINKTR